MLQRDGDGAFDYDLHGGSAPTRIQWYFRDQSRLPVAVHMWELPPGGAEGRHTHDETQPLEEIYVVVSGTAIMHVGGAAYELGPGDAVRAPVGVEHDLRNGGQEPLRVLVVWGEPGEPVDWYAYGTGRVTPG